MIWMQLSTTRGEIMIIGTGYIGRNLARLLPESRGANVYCRGMKDIVACQSHPYAAIQANALEPAEFAIMHAWPMVHIGSDHAYADGQQGRTVYAMSKLLGDISILNAKSDAMVLVTGHVYANDCPWIVWLDKELREGRQVVAYTNRICSPTWIGDVAEACKNFTLGRKFVLGPHRVDRYELYTAYAKVNGYDEGLIVPGLETNALLIGDSSHASDVATVDIYEGFARMKAEKEFHENRPAPAMA
jgi:dTDP-4-dehydrorhamnose reductase